MWCRRTPMERKREQREKASAMRGGAISLVEIGYPLSVIGPLPGELFCARFK